jgi:hypothetical protein
VLATVAIILSGSQETGGTRINTALNFVGWPSADRDLDTGQSEMVAYTSSYTPPLSHVLDVAQSEIGLLFVNRDGAMRFVERHAFFQAPEDDDHTWGDIDGEHRYRDIVIEFDESQIWNEVRVTPDGGDEQVADDQPSQNKYYRRVLERSVLLASENEAFDHTHYLLNRYKEPALRISALEPVLEAAMDQWPYLLDRDIGDRLLVRKRPEGGGLIEQRSYLQGVSHTWRPSRWNVVMRLAPVGAATDFWILGDTEWSVLGTTTIPGV